MCSILALVFDFVLLILTHELGHFLSAKRLGVGVKEFGLGYPPRILGKKIGKTVYSLNLIPFGGFVKIEGIDDQSFSPSSFLCRSWGEKTIILLSSIFANFFLAVLIFSLIFSLGVHQPCRVTIEGVAPNSPAELAGLREGDVVWKVEGKEIKDGESLLIIIRRNLGKRVDFQVKRGSTVLQFFLVPRREFPEGEGPVGILIRTHFEKKRYPIWQAPFVGLRESISLTWAMVLGLKRMLFNLLFRKIVPRDIAGPVGIANLAKEAASFGFLANLQFLGFLSLNLALVNLLPFPPLDGGRAFFVFLEGISGRRLSPAFQERIQRIGFVFLLILMVLVTIQDLHRLIIRKNAFSLFSSGFP